MPQKRSRSSVSNAPQVNVRSRTRSGLLEIVQACEWEPHSARTSKSRQACIHNVRPKPSSLAVVASTENGSSINGICQHVQLEQPPVLEHESGASIPSVESRPYVEDHIDTGAIVEAEPTMASERRITVGTVVGAASSLAELAAAATEAMRTEQTTLAVPSTDEMTVPAATTDATTTPAVPSSRQPRHKGQTSARRRGRPCNKKPGTAHMHLRCMLQND